MSAATVSLVNVSFFSKKKRSWEVNAAVKAVIVVAMMARTAFALSMRFSSARGFLVKNARACHSLHLGRRSSPPSRTGGSLTRPALRSMTSHSMAEETGPNDDLQSSTDLSEMLKEAYSLGETDGVQEAMTSKTIIEDLFSNLGVEEVASRLIGAAAEAAGDDRGVLAATVNAILAACCGGDETAVGHPRLAAAVLDLVNELHDADQSTMIAPDVVSFSLAYYALRRHDFAEEARAMLEHTRRQAKKQAGSRRRRALAAERRKSGNVMESEAAERRLQALYGPDIRVLHDTDDVIVIAKPAGMVCYHSKKTSAGKLTSSRKKRSRAANAQSNGGEDGTQALVDISLEDALLDLPCSLSTVNPTSRGIVHRIDRGTSGCIVLAKTEDAHLRLVALFFLRRVKKKYLALVPGKDVVNDLKERDHVDLVMGSSGTVDAPVGKRPALSAYRVLDAYGPQPSAEPEAILLEVETFTGRRHQVRCHCAALGRPIFLDPTYSSFGSDIRDVKRGGSRRRQKKKQMAAKSAEGAAASGAALPSAMADLANSAQDQPERFFLHAASLSIPELGISVDAPLPTWWRETVARWK